MFGSSLTGIWLVAYFGRRNSSFYSTDNVVMRIYKLLYGNKENLSQGSTVKEMHVAMYKMPVPSVYDLAWEIVFLTWSWVSLD